MRVAEIIRERVRDWAERGKANPEHYADDFVWDMSTASWTGDEEYHGFEGMEEFLRDWLRAWDDWTYEVEDVVETPDGRAAAIGVQRGVNRAAGVPVEMRMVQIWSVDEEGRATRVQMYTDAEAGLAAAGLT